MTILIHFVADWAEAVCGPHRAEVDAAAARLSASVRRCDVDIDWDTVREYRVANIPAVAIEGSPGTLVTGAFRADDLVLRLSPSRRHVLAPGRGSTT